MFATRCSATRQRPFVKDVTFRFGPQVDVGREPVRSPLWVRRRHRPTTLLRPLRSREWTSATTDVMPALGHELVELFDHFVSAANQCRWQSDGQFPRRLEVGAEFKSYWLFHRQVGRLCAFENFSNVAGGAPIHVAKVWAVGQRAAISNIDGRFPD